MAALVKGTSAEEHAGSESKNDKKFDIADLLKNPSD